jgi:flagellar biosynthesis/type III secretory pathway protein FliH
LNKEIVKKHSSNNNVYASFVILTLSLGLLFLYTTTIQPAQIFTFANAATTTNATQGAQTAANQTGEKMQAGAANATQQGKSAANQTGEKMQAGAANVTQGAKSIMNKTGETLQSFANKTGAALQKINPLK